MKTLIAVASVYAGYFGLGLLVTPAAIHKLVMML